MPNWHLAAVIPEDVDQILAIDRLAFKRPWQRNSFLEELACKHAYSYAVRAQRGDLNAEIIAYVFLRILMSEMQILRIAVAADFQDRGVATWLLQRCFRLARQEDVHSVYIEVRATNKTAIALYQKSGFQLLGRRTRYYPETGEDALVMVKHLKENL
jgi:[ribosomal protein S18]-alanine N-acetyltransferase